MVRRHLAHHVCGVGMLLSQPAASLKHGRVLAANTHIRYEKATWNNHGLYFPLVV